MFTEALFTITNLWKQPRCSTTDEWMKKKWYLYTMEFYSVIKKNEILSFTCKWMEQEIIISNEVAKFRKLNAMCFLSYTDYRPNKNTRNNMKKRSC
jgi:hypothetical protein